MHFEHLAAYGKVGVNKNFFSRYGLTLKDQNYVLYIV